MILQRFFCLSMFLVLAFAPTLSFADMVVGSVLGSVSSITGNAPGSITVGDSVTVDFSYNPDSTAQSSSIPTRRNYGTDINLLLAVRIGSDSWTSRNFNGEGSEGVRIENGYYNVRDQFRLAARTGDGNLSLTFFDTSAPHTLLDSLDLPTDLTDINPTSATSFGGVIESGGYRIVYQPDPGTFKLSLQTVPEPSTPVISGILFVLALLRRRPVRTSSSVTHRITNV